MSVQGIDKSTGRYRVIKTIGSSKDDFEVEKLVDQARQLILTQTGLQELDFTNYQKLYQQVPSSITSHKLAVIEYILGKIFNDIGFNQIPDSLFRDLVLYRLVYPKSKLKTVEYLQKI